MSDPTRAPAFTQFRSLFCSLVLDPELVLGRVLSAEWIAEVAVQEVGKTCDRIFTPLVTLALFLGQVFSDDHSCRSAVARLLAWRTACGLPRCSPDSGGYCKARRRLPDSLLPRLTRESADRLETQELRDWRFQGRRVVMVDGSTVSMPDTPANQRMYPQHSNQKRGCGFPIARIVVMLSLATGSVLDAAIGASKGKLTGEHALLRSLHRRLKPGDIVLADAYYSSFDEVMMLLQMGVDVVMRQTGSRPTDFRRGTKIGREDHLIEWHRHRNRWEWMSREAFAVLPRVLLMRELRVRVEKPGFRTKHFVVVTSLLDSKQYPRADVSKLYRARWNVELDIRSIKQTLKMDVLRCKSPELVVKEIWAHLLVYNLIRGVMAEAARRHGVEPRQISLQGARQTLEAFRSERAITTSEAGPFIRERILRAIAYHQVADRPDRAEPRVVKRRPKPYPRMHVPRQLARKRLMKAA
jgi:Transposase DDE domain